jgi:hypothetical protein
MERYEEENEEWGPKTKEYIDKLENANAAQTKAAMSMVALSKELNEENKRLRDLLFGTLKSMLKNPVTFQEEISRCVDLLYGK